MGTLKTGRRKNIDGSIGLYSAYLLLPLLLPPFDIIELPTYTTGAAAVVANSYHCRPLEPKCLCSC